MGRSIKPRILVIDDDMDFVDICGAHLSEKFEFHHANGGEEGINKIQLLRPCAILLDLNMPGVSGYEVLDYIRMWPSMRGLPVIVVTAGYDRKKLSKRLSKHTNVCGFFDKSAPMKKVWEEAERSQLLGRLYSSTPPLIKSFHRTEASRYQGIA